MTFDGIEIDMLSLGDADCLLFTGWTSDRYTSVLIDGGNKGSTQTVRQFLRTRRIAHLHHVVCTHPHDDHAAGLVQLLSDTTLTVGRVWLHRPQAHVSMLRVERALNESRGLQRAVVIQETLERVDTLWEICRARQIPVNEPFARATIGPMTVVGPTVDYYEELVAQFADSSAIRASEELVANLPSQSRAEALLERMMPPISESLEANPKTEPENNSSAILALPHTSGLHLFTGDAGAQALLRATQQFELADCHWMQIPHHGSRGNITEPLIAHFRPQQAFVSAAGNVKHPRRAVVNAFKNVGSRVYSTHYPRPGHLWHHRGKVPDRSDYSSAATLSEAKQ